ncbi:MAG: hypothetical protein MSS69_06280, partial [Spirochaetales bacterium]|nr:hypothetical protein [Spirochaetales bacterium]
MSKNNQPSVSTYYGGQTVSIVGKGKKSKPKIHNNLIKEYFRINEIFADFISGFFNSDIDSDMIIESDTTIEMNDVIVEGNTRICITKELIRDVAKKVSDKNGNQCLICIEDQSRYDKNMPVRVAMYDSLTLNSLIKKKYIPTVTVACNWDKRKLPNPMFLSSIGNSPYLNQFGASMLQLALAVFNVVEYID